MVETDDVALALSLSVVDGVDDSDCVIDELLLRDADPVADSEVEMVEEED